MKLWLMVAGLAAGVAGCAWLGLEDVQRVRVAPGESGTWTVGSLEAARDLVRTARKDGRLRADRRIEIVVAPGVYAPAGVFTLSEADSGTPAHPVVWRAERPGTVVFRGGPILAPASFLPVTDAAVLARLPPEARDKVRVCDVSACLPGALKPWPKRFDLPPPPWVYIDGRPATCARWPNADAPDGGWAHFEKSTDTGYPKADKYSNANKNIRPGAFRWDYPARGARWDFAAGVWLYGYWTHDWSEDSLQAKGFEEHEGETAMRLAGTHSYGCGNGTWGAKKRRFFVYNLLEELDWPGEWYLARETKKLYVCPVAGWEKAEIVLATRSQAFICVEKAHDVILEGFVFTCSHTAGQVLSLRDTQRVVVRNCDFSNLASSAISVSGIACRVEDCRMWNLGRNAISLSGGDRKKRVAAQNVVSGCDIHDYALFKRTYAPAVAVGGCGQIVRNCKIHDAPHNAVLYGGNDHLFESNEVYRVLLETGDAGAFYTGRDTSTLGTVIRGNYFHDLGRDRALAHCTMAIYFDDCDWGDAVYDNIFERAGMAVFIGGGNLHPVAGNLFVDCPVGVHMDTRGVTWRKGRNAFAPSADGTSWFASCLKPFGGLTNEVWRKAYPQLEALLADRPDLPRMNPVTNNTFVGCARNFGLDKLAKTVTNDCPFADNRFYRTREEARRAGVRLPAPLLRNR